MIEAFSLSPFWLVYFYLGFFINGLLLLLAYISFQNIIVFWGYFIRGSLAFKLLALLF
jgi:hypothetical protein